MLIRDSYENSPARIDDDVFSLMIDIVGEDKDADQNCASSEPTSPQDDLVIAVTGRECKATDNDCASVLCKSADLDIGRSRR